MVLVTQPPPQDKPLLLGVGDIYALARAIVERPKEVLQFGREWEEYLARYEKMIAGYGALTRIQGLEKETAETLEKAKKDAAEAAKVLDEAKVKAEKLEKVTSARIEKLEEETRVAIEAREREMTEREAAMAKANRAAGDLVSKTVVEVEQRQKELATREEQIVSRETIINSTIERMKAAGITLVL